MAPVEPRTEQVRQQLVVDSRASIRVAAEIAYQADYAVQVEFQVS